MRLFLKIKYLYQPKEGHWKFQGRRGVSYTEKMKGKYKPKLEFSLSMQGVWLFSGTTQHLPKCKKMYFEQ